MNKYVTARRRFLKQTSVGLGLAGLAMTEMSCRILSRDAGGISIVTFDNDTITSSVPPQWAIEQLKQAFQSLGAKVRLVSVVSQASAEDHVVIIASAGNPVAQEIIGGEKIVMSPAAEAILLARGTASRGRFCS